MTASKPEPLEIHGFRVAPGEQQRFDLPVALLPTHTQVHLPVTVVNGRRPGPRLWLSAAIHGDELNGIEIIRRVLARVDPLELHGALLCVPVVNVFGFLQQSRYLPDRRDLNRSFPGSPRGSLAARLAHLFLTEIVARSTHGIDLHTASNQRTNWPQVRGCLDSPETRRMAAAFGAPAMIHSTLRNGSLRATALRLGIPALVYEGGESLRFDPGAIDVGVRGGRGVMRALGMVRKGPRKQPPSLLIRRSTWVRARRGGLVRLAVEEGQRVAKGDVLATTSDPLGEDPQVIRAPHAGVVIGHSLNPVAHGGDAVVHLGEVESVGLPEDEAWS